MALTVALKMVWNPISEILEFKHFLGGMPREAEPGEGAGALAVPIFSQEKL